MARPTRTRQLPPTPLHPRTPVPLTLEVIERHVYQVPTGELATDIRQALADGNIERIADLVDFVMETDEATENAVMTVTETKR